MARDTKISLYLWSYPRSQVMKPDFLVARATRKPFSQGNLTFRENQIIRIAAKFQYKIPSLRILAVMDTISWSRGRPDRKSCTFLQRS